MSINHIDQLNEWYESAERITKTNLPRSGDYVISPFFNGTGYHIELEPDDWTADIVREEREDARVLARAPKPAWCDAPAVTATYRGDYGTVSGVWTPSANHGYWIGPEDDVVTHDSLEDVTPLIEAKVTGEMVEAARQEAKSRAGLYLELSLVSRMLTAALGLETK